MTGLKIFRLAPFCLLLLAGSVFAEHNDTSEADIINYEKVLGITIKNTGGRVFNAYKGKSCVVKMHLARDGSLLGFSTENGAPDLCNKLSDVMHSIKKLPAPPSDEIYDIFKDARLPFKP
ncbi:hypothetical protein DAX92_27485 [Salmonella enterica subsp. enterica]|uniref:Cell envelope integrity protein TolA n=1 Tax=Salmonella enterica I TaxID=59201 RepID=A0A7Z1Q8C9_SALET|nr:cell envelope integrity TolA C-terminal domain-containing protein [Salmonella enterica]EEJ3862155.1 hypothetical protein [Salmonella enterica subsp. enterica serovar Saintpaul]EAQ9806798.1 hypothetical protein [Salmonella enterica]EAV3945488.1 hypothetical protein [Salmonella enterica]ECI9603270.1 hypothetical protein [Salmonella enterica]EEC1444735.1 hypothetical protein [Salmonella enterica]